MGGLFAPSIKMLASELLTTDSKHEDLNLYIKIQSKDL